MRTEFVCPSLPCIVQDSVLNLIGSVTLMINGFFYGAYPSGFLNVIWGSVALYTLWTVRSKPLNGSS